MQKIRKLLWLRKGKVVPERVQPEFVIREARMILMVYKYIQSALRGVLYLFLHHTLSSRARHVDGRQCAGEYKLVPARPVSVREGTREDKKGTILDFYASPP
jgi:hypothetical protein